MTEIDMKGVSKGALLGGVIAGAIGIVLYFVGSAIGADFKPMRPEEMGMTVLPPFQPMVICLIAAVVSIGVMFALKKVAPAKAWSVYLAVAVFVFLVELYLPFWAFADMKTILTLELMHLPPTLLIVGGIKRFGFRAAAPVPA